MGLTSDYGLGMLISKNIPILTTASVPLWAAALALGFSGFVGVVFGI